MSILSDPAEVRGKARIEAMFWSTPDGAPWHGLGKEVPEALTAAEALEASGQGWTVSTESLVTSSGIPIRDGRRCKAIVRDDTRTVLGIVGRRYQPIQNSECFDFMDSLAADRTIRYHTAGVIGGGERIWILAQMPGEIRIGRTDDIVKKFLLFSNSHDGTSAGRVFWTPIRVVCANTLNQAHRERRADGDAGVVIRHTGNLAGKIAEAQRILGLGLRAYDDLAGQINTSAKFKMSDALLKSYFRSLFPGSKGNDEDGTPDDVSTRTQNTLDSLQELFTAGRGNDMKGIKGSAWAAYNAVTQFTDYQRPTRVSKGSNGELVSDEKSKRLESIWFGSGARLKEKAWSLAQDMIADPEALLASIGSN